VEVRLKQVELGLFNLRAEERRRRGGEGRS
jgi:hypothetical protein